ncbi:MAG: DUF1059 domain-containing protein [Candidatus Limnocylindrales bacterium]
MGTAVLLVRCACGWQVESDSEEEVVAATQDHGRRLHNMLPTRDQVLAMLVPAERSISGDPPSAASDRLGADGDQVG